MAAGHARTHSRVAHAHTLRPSFPTPFPYIPAARVSLEGIHSPPRIGRRWAPEERTSGTFPVSHAGKCPQLRALTLGRFWEPTFSSLLRSTCSSDCCYFTFPTKQTSVQRPFSTGSGQGEGSGEGRGPKADEAETRGAQPEPGERSAARHSVSVLSECFGVKSLESPSGAELSSMTLISFE